MRKLLMRLFGKEKKGMATKVDFENEVFLKIAQEQMKELKRKGLSIPIVTL